MACTQTRTLCALLITAATAFVTYQGAPPRVSRSSGRWSRSAPKRISRRRAAAVEDIDPLAVLGLDAGALAVLDTAARAKEVRRAYRKAALDSHPDTSALDRADRFSLVQRAADLLRQDDVLDRLVAGGAAGARKAQDDKLSRLWRDEVREWSVERLSEHLRSKGLSDDVIDAFAEEEVDGREVVGLEMWGGADTDGYIWSLRWLGTEEEAVAARTEEVLRDLIRRDLSNNFKHDAWAQQANAQGGNWDL